MKPTNTYEAVLGIQKKRGVKKIVKKKELGELSVH